jgi:two-component system, LuxR family, sensor kinase FixL
MFSPDAQALMEAAVDAVVVIDHHGRILAVNDSCRRIFGYRSDELLGNNVVMLMPERERSAHDGHIARYIATGKAAVIGVGRQVTAQRADGALFPASLTVGQVPRTMPPRFVGMIRDVTRDVEATQALKLERDRSNAYLELNEAILVSLDAAGRVTEVNARGSELLGAAPADLVGRDWLSFTADGAERERARLLLEQSLVGNSSREFDSLDAAGQARRIHWRCIARRAADGTPAGWLCSGEDVTARARDEADKHRAQQHLTRIARLATMGELATGMAHELNQPLTAIVAYARACERYLDQPQPDLAEAREAAREISAEGLRAGATIHRLRRLVRTDVDEDRAAVDTNELIEELQDTMTADARAHGCRLDVSLAPGLPHIVAHGPQIQHVLLNLVRNAFEALGQAPRAERLVTVETARGAANFVEIRVSDTGPGVDPAIAGQMFEPFRTTKPQGTGLGLAISRTIIQSHKGSIGVRSGSSGGSTFVVTLPGGNENQR